jgi:hypothetical protein
MGIVAVGLLPIVMVDKACENDLKVHGQYFTKCKRELMTVDLTDSIRNLDSAVH